MTDTPRFAMPEIDDVPDDIRERILEVQEKSGFVPNVFLMLARRPAEWRAFFGFHDAVMEREESSLTRGEREMIVTTISAQNGCLYCVVAHGALLRIFEKNPQIADQVAVNHRTADLTARQRAILDFATKVNLDPAAICDADFDALAEHGLDTEDVWDVAAITGLFGLSNRMATTAAIAPNPEFYLMGRVPRTK